MLIKFEHLPGQRKVTQSYRCIYNVSFHDFLWVQMNSWLYWLICMGRASKQSNMKDICSSISSPAHLTAWRGYRQQQTFISGVDYDVGTCVRPKKTVTCEQAFCAVAHLFIYFIFICLFFRTQNLKPDFSWTPTDLWIWAQLAFQWLI